MATDSLKIFGDNFTGVTGIKATDSNNNTKTYIRPQGTLTVSSSGVTDVTAYESVDVSDSNLIAGNIKKGVSLFGVPGAFQSYTLLGSAEIAVNTTSTSAASAGTITIGSAAWDKAKIIYVRVRDEAGARKGYHFGSDAWFVNFQHANGGTSNLTAAGRIGLNYSSEGAWASASASYGVYGYSISSAGVVTIRRRYNSSYTGTINGTFLCEVYALDFPNNDVPWDDIVTT